jgi:hypothetical protein
MKIFVGDVDITQILYKYSGKYITLELSEYNSRKKTCCGGIVYLLPELSAHKQYNLFSDVDYGTDAMAEKGGIK